MSCKIAIILINYNGVNDTIDCIKSLMESTILGTIIVVDNASTNDDVKKLKDEFTDVVIIESKKNLGFSGGNNLGIRYAIEHGFEIFILLNNDTVVASDMIQMLRMSLTDNNIVVPAMYYFSEHDKLWYGGGEINNRTGNAVHKCYNIERECTYATGCCIAITKDIIERIGYFDERYFMYCEDLEYSLRLHKNNVEILYQPAAKLWHKVGMSSGGGESAFSIYYVTRNRLNFIRENRDYFKYSAYLYAYCSRLIRMIQFMLKGKIEWRAFRSGMRDHKKNIWGQSFKQ